MQLRCSCEREGDGVEEHFCSAQCTPFNVVLASHNNITGKLLPIILTQRQRYYIGQPIMLSDYRLSFVVHERINSFWCNPEGHLATSEDEIYCINIV